MEQDSCTSLVSIRGSCIIFQRIGYFYVSRQQNAYIQLLFILSKTACIGAHGATDVTGFGILGHARNLASCQKAPVAFNIHTLPSEHLCACTFKVNVIISFVNYYFCSPG